MGINDKNQLYALCKHKETKEYHVFLTYKGADDKCYFADDNSICSAMHKANKESCIISCATETQIRQKAAELGSIVCGNCMKTSYKTKEK